MIRPLLSAGSYLTAGTLVQVALAFGANIVLLRSLGPHEFGHFAVTLAGISLIASILSLRLGVVVTRTPEAEFTAELQSRYFTAMLVEVAVVMVVSGLWLVISGRTGWTDVVLLGAVGLQSFCSHVRSFWERTMPYRRIAIAETAVVAVAQFAAVAIVLVTGSDAALYLREAIAALATLTALWLAAGLTFRPLAWPRLREWVDLLREARSIWLDSILEGVFQRVTVIAAAALAGSQGAGLFSMAQRLAVLPHQVIQPFGRVAVNWFSRTTTDSDRQRARNRLILTLLVPLLVAALFAVLTADPLVPWLFGDHWRDAIPILIAMSGAMVFLTIFEITRGYALATKQTPALLWARVAQFGAFGLGAGVAWVSGEGSLFYLGSGLSAAFAAAFAVQLALSRRRTAS